MNPLIHIVEDDPIVCRSLICLFKTVGFEARSYPSPAHFLAGFEPDRPGCILVDLRLPDVGGLGLQTIVRDRKWSHPTIFLTAHGDVHAAVRAMKAGAFDFIQKPYDERQLVETISAAVRAHLQIIEAERQSNGILKRIRSLSPRERRIVELVVEGKSTRQIAADLGLSSKTIDNHRANILAKMQVDGVVELVRAYMEAQVFLDKVEERSDVHWGVVVRGGEGASG